MHSDTDKSELCEGRIREAKDVVWNEAALLPAAPQARMAAYLEYRSLSEKDGRGRDGAALHLACCVY